jgi:DNA-binding response OmpR family regulator
VLRAGPLEISPDQHLARVDGRTLTLSIREVRLLTELARRLDRIVSREDLFLLVWGRAMRSGDRSVDVYVRRLRVKLAVASPGWSFIHTHFGLGYRLCPDDLDDLTSRSQLSNTRSLGGVNTASDQGSQSGKEITES